MLLKTHLLKADNKVVKVTEKQADTTKKVTPVVKKPC